MSEQRHEPAATSGVKPQVSVIVPTRNPRRDYLERVLEGLRHQALPIEKWELLLVDNASEPAVATYSDLSWHPCAKHLLEQERGLGPARVRGSSEAAGDLLVFVDDDNVLAPDYLALCVAIADAHPHLGAWSGNVIPEFEVTPAPELGPYLPVLCIRKVAEDTWSNLREIRLLPWGAGMCVRKVVAKEYVRQSQANPLRQALGKDGVAPRGANDFELAWCSFDVGLGTGLFKSLSVTHLMPAARAQPENLLKQIEVGTIGYTVFCALRGIKNSRALSRVDTLVETYKAWRASPMQKQVAAARRRGEQAARKILARLNPSGQTT